MHLLERPVAARALCALAFTLCVLCPSRSSSAQSTPDPSLRELDGYLRAELTRLRVPGAAVAVVRDGWPVYTFVFGRADESGRAVTLDTPFMIGSISKSMTALGAMELVGAGRLDLDAPVARYLPWFHPTGHAGWRQVTVRNLLNQDSGIPSSAGRSDWANPDTSAGALERHTRGLARVRLANPPGTTFEYANANYALVGQVIQAVTGTSYEQYIQEHLFSPLGMTRSFAFRRTAEQHGLALGHRFWFGLPVAARLTAFVRSTISAGYLMASVTDMVRYLGMQVQEGRYPGGALASPGAIEETHRPVSKMTDQWSYAMGWVAGTLAGDTVLWHNGLVPGFYAFMAIIPGRREGVVVLTNAANILDMPRLNGMAFGALTRLLNEDAAADQLSCAMCPVFPKTPIEAVLAIRPIAIILLALQCSWIAWSSMRRRWRSRKANAISLVCSIGWAAFALLLVPLAGHMPLSVMNDLVPDVAAVIYSSVAIALAWASTRIGIAVTNA